MTTFRLALIAIAAMTVSTAASAQTGSSSNPPVQQSSDGGCSFKARPAATS